MPPLIVEMTAKAARGQRSKSRSFPGRAFLAAIALCAVLWACETQSGMVINPDEIPIYPNAQGVVREGPLHYAPPDAVDQGWAEAYYVWRFTTSDPPDAVWAYYVGQMRRRWGFDDWSSPQSDPREMVVTQTCPFYSFFMTSKATDSASYSITLTLFMGYCA